MKTQRRPPRLLSNHFPILLECDVVRRGRSPFRFENTWLKAGGFIDFVKIGGFLQFHGTLSFVLANKLKALKLDLKKWNETVFGDIA